MGRAKENNSNAERRSSRDGVGGRTWQHRFWKCGWLSASKYYRSRKRGPLKAIYIKKGMYSLTVRDLKKG